MVLDADFTFSKCGFQVMLPDTMPPSFSATYTPIAAAGTDAQVQHLSRLLATQLTVAGLGKGVHEMQGKTKVILSIFCDLIW